MASKNALNIVNLIKTLRNRNVEEEVLNELKPETYSKYIVANAKDYYKRIKSDINDPKIKKRNKARDLAYTLMDTPATKRKNTWLQKSKNMELGEDIVVGGGGMNAGSMDVQSNPDKTPVGKRKRFKVLRRRLKEMNEAAKSPSTIKGVGSNARGVMHELLVGYHLNGGKHMEKHHSSAGESPEQTHNRLKSGMSPEAYTHLNNKAKAAADDIRKKIPHGIKSVHWTSKPGDITRTTGIKSTQHDDPSDIVVTNKKGVHHGISLKATSGKAHIPVSNPGMESTLGAHKILQAHRDGLDKKYSKIRTATNKSERKEFLASNPKAKTDISRRNTQVLHDIVDHVHKKLTAMPKSDMAKHIRNVVLKANPTPMQREGHVHIRHTTHGEGEYHFSHLDPSTHHEHILKDHNNISASKAGTSIIFSHKGKPFARHRFKFESQSDPKSGVKGSGELIGK